MRDAMGGTFMMYMIITFVVIFVMFMAETMNYVKAYRVKNMIINYIEQYEGFDQKVIDILEKEPNGKIIKAGYNNNGACTINTSIPSGAGQTYCSKYGYSVQIEYSNGSQAYYKVTTYILLDFTRVLGIDPLKIPVSGETMLVTIE